MKIKLNELDKIVKALNGLNSIPFPFKTTLNMRKFLKEADEALDVFAEKYRELFKKYCKLDENGSLIPGEDAGSFVVNDNVNTEDMIKEFNELETLEEEFIDFNIPENALEGQKITLEDLEVLERFIQ